MIKARLGCSRGDNITSAGADACLEFTWTQDPHFSIASAIARMEKAIAAAPDMLVFSLADPVAMRPTVERALSAGIPVITINVPDPQPRGERLPYLIYIGPDEYEGGVVAAKLVLAKITPRKAACLNSLPDHAGTRARCRGWADTLSAAGVATSVVDVSGGADRARPTSIRWARRGRAAGGSPDFRPPQAFAALSWVEVGRQTVPGELLPARLVGYVREAVALCELAPAE